MLLRDSTRTALFLHSCRLVINARSERLGYNLPRKQKSAWIVSVTLSGTVESPLDKNVLFRDGHLLIFRACLMSPLAVTTAPFNNLQGTCAGLTHLVSTGTGMSNLSHLILFWRFGDMYRSELSFAHLHITILMNLNSLYNSGGWDRGEGGGDWPLNNFKLLLLAGLQWPKRVLPRGAPYSIIGELRCVALRYVLLYP